MNGHCNSPRLPLYLEQGPSRGRLWGFTLVSVSGESGMWCGREIEGMGRRLGVERELLPCAF